LRLRRLGLERIDLFQLHRVDPQPLEEQLGVFVELQREGKVRHVGLSNVSVARIRRARATAPIVTVQNRYNLTDRGSEDVLASCEAGGLGFIPWVPGGHRPARPPRWPTGADREADASSPPACGRARSSSRP
jgi:pyridoxine 4-dehydrogenase